MLKIGLIGCGLIGQVHARSLKILTDNNLVEAKLAIACDSNIENAEKLAKEFGFECSVNQYKEVTENKDIDVVYICVPTSLHGEIVESAAKNGKHIFCEKPLAHNAEEAFRMLEIIKENGIKAQVGLVLRYAPIFEAVNSLIRGGLPNKIGRPMAATVFVDQHFPIMGRYASNWRADKNQAGAGTLIEHAIHDIDILQWFFGPVESVSAQESNFAGHDGIEDVSSAILKFKNGGIANILSIWHNVMQRQSERSMEFAFENTWIKITEEFIGDIEVQQGADFKLSMSASDVLAKHAEQHGYNQSQSSDLSSGYLQESRAFLTSISGSKTPFPGFETAVNAHSIVDAIYKSAREKKEIEVKYLCKISETASV